MNRLDELVVVHLSDVLIPSGTSKEHLKHLAGKATSALPERAAHGGPCIDQVVAIYREQDRNTA